MADKQSTSTQLKIVAKFSDGDERTISYDNPRSDITAAEIKALDSLASGVLIGDKYGAPFSTFADAGIYQITQVDLDISGSD